MQIKTSWDLNIYLKPSIDAVCYGLAMLLMYHYLPQIVGFNSDPKQGFFRLLLIFNSFFSDWETVSLPGCSVQIRRFTPAAPLRLGSLVQTGGCSGWWNRRLEAVQCFTHPTNRGEVTGDTLLLLLSADTGGSCSSQQWKLRFFSLAVQAHCWREAAPCLRAWSGMKALLFADLFISVLDPQLFNRFGLGEGK